MSAWEAAAAAVGGCGGSTVPVTASSHDRQSASSAGSYLDAAYLCNGGKAFRVSGARVERGLTVVLCGPRPPLNSKGLE